MVKNKYTADSDGSEELETGAHRIGDVSTLAKDSHGGIWSFSKSTSRGSGYILPAGGVFSVGSGQNRFDRAARSSNFGYGQRNFADSSDHLQLEDSQVPDVPKSILEPGNFGPDKETVCNFRALGTFVGVISFLCVVGMALNFLLLPVLKLTSGLEGKHVKLPTSCDDLRKGWYARDPNLPKMHKVPLHCRAPLGKYWLVIFYCIALFGHGTAVICALCGIWRPLNMENKFQRIRPVAVSVALLVVASWCYLGIAIYLSFELSTLHRLAGLKWGLAFWLTWVGAGVAALHAMINCCIVYIMSSALEQTFFMNGGRYVVAKLSEAPSYQ